MKKVIGITSGFELDANYYFKGYPRMMLNEDYSRSILQAGGVPIVLPVHNDYDVVFQQVSLVDGILLSGGQDIQPLLYQQQPHAKLGLVCPQRDVFEYHVIKAALEQNKPIFGICRGLQILNVYFGGTLLQDNAIKGDVQQHVQAGNPDLTMHSVKVAKGSFIELALKKETIDVNTFHHQSIDKIADELAIVALSPDGIVEAIQHKSKQIYAVQWHPEMLSRQNEDAQKIFDYFIKVVKGDSHE